MSKSGGTLYIGFPPLQILGGRVPPPVPQGLRLWLQWRYCHNPQSLPPALPFMLYSWWNTDLCNNTAWCRVITSQYRDSNRRAKMNETAYSTMECSSSWQWITRAIWRRRQIGAAAAAAAADDRRHLYRHRVRRSGMHCDFPATFYRRSSGYDVASPARNHQPSTSWRWPSATSFFCCRISTRIASRQLHGSFSDSTACKDLAAEPVNVWASSGSKPESGYRLWSDRVAIALASPILT